MEKNNYQGALQQPIGSRFHAASTSEDIMKGIDLSGKTAIVTGGYSGIGLETVKSLASAGATVIVPAKNADKARTNLSGIENVELETIDLSSTQSIDRFADKFLASCRPLSLLINNAGIMWAPLQRDERGNESQLSANYLGHFRLTARLWSALKATGSARVINVSSWGHHYSPFIFEDPNFLERGYDTMLAYGQSKTASTLFTVELDRRGKDAGVRSYSVHPGIIVGTDLGRNLSPEVLRTFGVLDESGNPIVDISRGLKTVSQGASTTLWCATSPKLDVVSGVYCEDVEVAELDLIQHEGQAVSRDTALMRGVSPYALDETSAMRLWLISEELSGMKFETI